jgi:hypothetical protein
MADIMKRDWIQLSRTIEKAGRLVSLGLFWISLVGPWGTMMGDVVYGSDMLRLPFDFVGDAIRGGSGSQSWLPFGLYFLFGWAWSGAYWVVSFARVFGRHPIWRRFWLTLPLVVTTGFWGVYAYFRLTADGLNRFWWPSLNWGYWLFLLSTGASILLEFVWHLTDHFVRKQQTAA